MTDHPDLCECCETKPAVYDGLCRDCAHPDDVDFYEYDPGEDYL